MQLFYNELVQNKWSELANLPVASLAGTRKVGVVEAPIFNASTGSFLGFWVKLGWLNRKVLPWNAIREIEERDPNRIKGGVHSGASRAESGAVVVSSSDELVAPQDVIRVQEALKARCPILGQRAVNESGEYIGRVKDVSVDFAQGMLTTLHIVKGKFAFDIPREKIVEVRADAVVVEVEEKIKAGERATAQNEPALAEGEPA